LMMVPTFSCVAGTNIDGDPSNRRESNRFV
jgi:hypothetical protein